MDGVLIYQSEPLQCRKTGPTETLQYGLPVALQLFSLQHGDAGGGVGVEGRVDVEDPAVVRGHRALGHDKSAAEASRGGKNGAQPVRLRGGQDVEDDEDGDPHLVDEEERQEGSEKHSRREDLVDQEKHDGGADSKRECADGGHADEHLQDELMGARDAVRVLEVEEFEWLQEEAVDDGAHEEGAGAAQDASDGHDLDRVGCVEVCGP